MDDGLDERFAKFLRAERGETSYAKFSDIVGIPASTLHWIENRQGKVTLALVELAGKNLSKSLTDIFGDLASENWKGKKRATKKRSTVRSTVTRGK